MHFKSIFLVAIGVWLPYVIAQIGPSFSIDAGDFVAEDYVIYGSGDVSSGGLRVSNQGDPFGTIILKNQPMQVANGFYTEFIIDITNCDNNPSYNGADGFTFVLYPELPNIQHPPGGSALGVTTSNNFATVAFVIISDVLAVCAVNSSSTLGGLSLTDATQCVQQDTSMSNALRDLRCNGPHKIGISFAIPDSWGILIDDTLSYSFTLDLFHTLNWTDSYSAYPGFSGGVGAGYMTQQITRWSMETVPGCLGSCDPIAQCTIRLGTPSTVECSCPNGYDLDGRYCNLRVRSDANIVPILECFEKYGENEFEAFYGYESFENESVGIPQGPLNQFTGVNVANYPSAFTPGRTQFHPLSDFSVKFDDPNTLTLTWRLSNYQVSFATDDNTKRCSANLPILLRFDTGRELSVNEIFLILGKLYDLLDISPGRILPRNITYYSLGKRDTTQLAELELEISGTNSTTQNEPRASEIIQELVETSYNATIMNQVINPDSDNPDPSREFIEIKTLSSGTETVGQIVPESIAPLSSVASDAESQIIGQDKVVIWSSLAICLVSLAN